MTSSDENVYTMDDDFKINSFSDLKPVLDVILRNQNTIFIRQTYMINEINKLQSEVFELGKNLNKLIDNTHTGSMNTFSFDELLTYFTPKIQNIDRLEALENALKLSSLKAQFVS